MRGKVAPSIREAGFHKLIVEETVNGAQALERLREEQPKLILNIASAVIPNEGRAVFVMMVADPLLVDGTSGRVLKEPDHRS